MRDYDLFLPGYPAILGSDASGTVASLGSSVQQYCVMPSSLIAPIPTSTSFEQATGISLATMAVAIAFYHTIGYGMTPPWSTGGEKVGKGKSMVILGGASSVGQYAVQLAKLSGFEKIVTNSGVENIEM